MLAIIQRASGASPPGTGCATTVRENLEPCANMPSKAISSLIHPTDKDSIAGPARARDRCRDQGLKLQTPKFPAFRCDFGWQTTTPLFSMQA
ncbi:hypothetical protein PEC18_03785 [Paucibacter sp. O1-1]|nr:hypothetical protein [Paucibacter sp. O1-1]MDA3824996.1 hypothetical protein [Paucibacter sp. O1-1]